VFSFFRLYSFYIETVTANYKALAVTVGNYLSTVDVWSYKLERGVGLEAFDMNNVCYRLLLLVAAAITLTACDTGPKSAKGFRLPDGDAQAGRQLFVQLECNSCHTIIGLELPEPAEPGPVSVSLGGPVAKVKSYGQLVSSVINPSHKIVRRYPKDEVTRDGESLMPVYNETMTVQQLIDLVAFLQAQYRVPVPQYSYYTYQY